MIYRGKGFIELDPRLANVSSESQQISGRLSNFVKYKNDTKITRGQFYKKIYVRNSQMFTSVCPWQDLLA
jgi:hypothetical protein